MRCHCPPASFIGYFRRRSPCTSSRTDAPFAQCVPRLMGLSQDGSWPTQTPFWTSAVTVQPTEQCVQTFLRICTLWPGGVSAALALRIEPSCTPPRAASPPAARPERFRKPRRSRTSAASPVVRAWRLLRRASPPLRLISMAALLLQGLVAVGSVERLDVLALTVAGAPLVRPGVIGSSFRRRERRGNRSRGHGR